LLSGHHNDLDEFPALGNVNVLAKSVAFIAGYGIRLLTVVQSPAQLRAIYGTDAARNFSRDGVRPNGTGRRQ
jgi:type IV secretory pathway TraG/TraD family ATPase VirD4